MQKRSRFISHTFSDQLNIEEAKELIKNAF